MKKRHSAEQIVAKLRQADVGLGKGMKETWPKPGQLPLDEVVVNNRFD